MVSICTFISGRLKLSESGSLRFFWLTSVFGTEGTEHLRFAGFVVGTGSRAGVTRQLLASVSTHTLYQMLPEHAET
jgi:hypothetical protein